MSLREMNLFIDEVIILFHKSQALIVAIAAFIIAGKNLINVIRDIYKIPNGSGDSGGAKMAKSAFAKKFYEGIKELTFLRKSILFLCIFLSFSIVATRGLTQPKFENEILTEAAWIAYNKEQYEDAIKKAQKCIKEFEDDAIEKQKELADSKTPLPLEGEKSINISKEQREEIFKRGLLNDVAACWYIKAKSLENLGANKEAKKAFEKTAQFTYARVWDPKWKGFWSPAKKAQSILRHMQ